MSPTLLPRQSVGWPVLALLLNNPLDGDHDRDRTLQRLPDVSWKLDRDHLYVGENEHEHSRDRHLTRASGEVCGGAGTEGPSSWLQADDRMV